LRPGIFEQHVTMTAAEQATPAAPADVSTDGEPGGCPPAVSDRPIDPSAGEAKSMLDVHPAHQPAQTWAGFFIHIATISIGLLIAIGLEQTVEWVHRKHQVMEAREAIAQERELNRRLFAETTEYFRAETKRFQTNLVVLEYLREHPGVPRQAWPGEVSWHSFNTAFSAAAWETAQHSAVTALMPQGEVRDSERLYHYLGVVLASGAERLRAITSARRYTSLDSDPSHLTAQQLAEEVALAESVLTAHYRLGSEMRNLHSCFPDFTPNPSTDELRAIVHEPPLSEEEARRLGMHAGERSEPRRSGCIE
jgi:hypothetical protein